MTVSCKEQFKLQSCNTCCTKQKKNSNMASETLIILRKRKSVWGKGLYELVEFGDVDLLPNSIEQPLSQCRRGEIPNLGPMCLT